jgi:LuxR family maltose regulon positive regulatory protein
MAANPEVAAAWNAAPLTKFRPPRVRRDAIARPRLLARLAASVAEQPLTLICAPGGFGKTSLLAQLAAAAAADAALVWIALDEDDNECHRFFVTMVRAIEPLQLAWETPPATLTVNAAGSLSQCRAGLAALVNALCTASAHRVVVVLDDLHRITSPQIYELLEALVERLPDHVALVLASRVEPPLPLARWRAHGELAELAPWDLQFTEHEAEQLAAARLGAPLDPDGVRNVWRRMHGWAAGLTIALQAPRAGALRAAPTPSEAADRHLFAYLAQEILAELPDDMRDFLLACSLLSELSPPACAFVSGADNAAQLLEALYRRNLFVTATDDATPVLRFHDLFREFLESELERRWPERLQELHARAGRVERSLPRAIAHFMRAEQWSEAMRALAENGEAMLADGEHALLERWLDQLPDAVRRTDPKLSYLRGVCAWLRWDWRRAREELEPAVAGLGEAPALRVRALFLLADAFNSSGDRERSWAMLEDLARLPLEPLARAQLALQRAWCLMPAGDPQGVGRRFQEFIAHAEQDPALICPRTADRIHLLCIGLPGVAQAFQRYYSLCENLTDQMNAPWRLAALAVGAWGSFWSGRREPLPAILQQGEALHQKFGGIRLVSERLLQFRTLFYAASGQFDAATTLSKRLIDALQTPEAAAHRATWLRSYQHALARMYWMARDYDSYRALAPTLLAPRLPTEWPYMDTAIELMRGQLAILREDWSTAQAALGQAVRTHAQHRLPMTHGDPRISLAWMHLLLKDETQSWRTFEPVLKEVLEDQAIGLLLLEPAFIVDDLLKLTPAEIRRSDAYAGLAARMALWRPDPSAPASQTALKGPLASLSEREREVLAQVAAGASNKHIARDLALSLHTVKRHIANILDKLDCGSRGQAADAYRRAQLGSSG